MRICATLLILITFGPAVVARADWPQFRGPTGDGVACATGLPVT